jgi:hypothetical protein
MGWLAGVLLLCLPAAAQLGVGDNLSMDLSGNLGVGYTGVYGNQFASSHSLSGSGTATLTGSYYNPNFLSFNVSPYYGQSRSNSTSQSIFDSSGVNATTSLFSGSHFPGSINYAKSYNSEGNFGVPGVADYTTRGNNDSFGIAWSENLPDEPSLSVSFQRGSNQYSVFGTDQNGNSTFHSLTLHSAYSIEGFGLSAFYDRGASNSLIPQILTTDAQPEQVNSDNSGYGFNVSHRLPMRGGFSSGFSHSEFGTAVLGTSFNGSVNLITASAGIQPNDKLHLGVGTTYSSSLSGQLFESEVAAGAVVPGQNLNSDSHGFDVTGTASYSINKKLQAEVDVERREQRFLGDNLGSNSYSGSLVYTTGFLGGNFNAAGSIRDNTLDGSSQNSLGFSVSSNYTRRINDWVLNGSVNYAQNVQTQIITYMSSFYNYSGNIRRRWGKFSWSAGGGAGRTGLTTQSGTMNTNESFTSGIGYSRYLTLSGSYSKSSGNGIQTATGIVQNPVLLPVTSSAILFSGDSYSFGLGSNPIKKFTLSASYARGNSLASVNSLATSTTMIQYNGLFQYQVRKLYLTGGYSRLQQEFNTQTAGPAVISSFYIGLSRWFNFF